MRRREGVLVAILVWGHGFEEAKEEVS